MHKKVVVENTLQFHINFFEQYGYDAHKLYKNENNIEFSAYDAIVISNMKNVPMGAIPTLNIRIIEVEGKTSEEGFNILRSKY